MSVIESTGLSAVLNEATSIGLISIQEEIIKIKHVYLKIILLHKLTKAIELTGKLGLGAQQSGI